MNIYKKILCIMLISLLAFTAVACNSQADNTKVESQNETGPVSIRLAMKDEGPSNPEAVRFFKELEKGLEAEGVNVKIDLVEVPAGNYAEKLNLMLNSGDIPDIIYFQGGDMQISNQDLLEDLNPYIEKSEYIKNILQPQNEERLKNYPYLLWIKPPDSRIPVVRKDWFEMTESSQNLISNPTIENYYVFLKELKDKDFDGKGNPQYGLTVAGDITELDQVFDQAFGNTSTWIKNQDGKYVYKKVTDNEKEKLAFYRKLYDEGILDKEFLTKKWDTKEQSFYDGQVGMIMGTAGKIIDIYEGKMKKANGQDANLISLPPASGKAQGYLPIDITKESRGVAISAVSKHKDLAFEVLDYLASPKGQLLDRLGYENEHYQIKDNKIYLTEKSQEWYARFWEPKDVNVGMELATPLLQEAGAKSLDLTYQYYTEDTNFLLPDEYVPTWDAISNIYKEYAADIITGKRPVEDFDEFVQAWYKSGGQEITDYANQVLK